MIGAPRSRRQSEGGCGTWPLPLPICGWVDRGAIQARWATDPTSSYCALLLSWPGKDGTILPVYRDRHGEAEQFSSEGPVEGTPAGAHAALTPVDSNHRRRHTRAIPNGRQVFFFFLADDWLSCAGPREKPCGHLRTHKPTKSVSSHAPNREHFRETYAFVVVVVVVERPLLEPFTAARRTGRSRRLRRCTRCLRL